MPTAHKIKLSVIAYWFALVLALVILGPLSIQFIEWILLKLYELVVQKTLP